MNCRQKYMDLRNHTGYQMDLGKYLAYRAFMEHDPDKLQSSREIMGRTESNQVSALNEGREETRDWPSLAIDPEEWASGMMEYTSLLQSAAEVGGEADAREIPSNIILNSQMERRYASQISGPCGSRHGRRLPLGADQ